MALSSSARADGNRRIGIVVTVKVNVSAVQASNLASQLGDVIRKELPVDVLAGAEVDRRLPAAGVPANCVALAECRADLGRRLDAHELLMLVVVKIGDKVRIDSTWANVASGEVITRPAISLASGSNRTKLFRDAVPRLLPHIKKKTETKDGGTKIVVVPVPGGGNGTGTGRDEPKHRFTTGVWIAAGVALATGIAGGVFALSASSKFNALEQDGCHDRACDPARIKSMENHALAADLLLGTALVSTVTAVIFYATSAPAAEKTPTKREGLSVGVLPGGVGVSYGGSF